MSNVHGFGEVPPNHNNRNNPNNQPPNRPNNNRPVEDGNAGFFEGFQPVIEDQLRVAQ
jgi:hypothetical protein